MNIYFKEIQRSFDLINKKKVNQSSFMKALEYMLKIANESKYQVEKCLISADKDKNVIISLSTKQSQITITANSNGISCTGTGPKKEDNIRFINTESRYVSDTVFEWIKRNRKINYKPKTKKL